MGTEGEETRESREVIVSLGSNIAPREEYLASARLLLSELPETRMVAASRVIETKGVDVPEEFCDRDFLNQILILESSLPPLEFSRRMHAIEDRLGRVRTVKNGPRTIDIDLIKFGEVRMESEELTLPHPRAKERAFVMEPLKELIAKKGIDFLDRNMI